MQLHTVQCIGQLSATNLLALSESIAPRLKILILISGEAFHVHVLEDNIVKMPILKLIYKYNVVPIPAALFFFFFW